MLSQLRRLVIIIPECHSKTVLGPLGDVIYVLKKKRKLWNLYMIKFTSGDFFFEFQPNLKCPKVNLPFCIANMLKNVIIPKLWVMHKC